MHSGKWGEDRGFAMAALLVTMSIMAIAMSVALPVWHTASRREKEAELIFRGQQYARAVMLYQRRFPGAAPPNLDILLNEHMLRKKYKDPITNGDFQLVGAADTAALQNVPGGPTTGVNPSNPAARPGTTTTPAAGGGIGGGFPSSGAFQNSGALQNSGAQQPGSAISSSFGRPAASLPGTAAGGIMGVVSKSTDTSLRLYNGRNKYNEWVFLATQASTRAGGPGGGAAGGRGGQQQPGEGGPGGARGRNGFPPAGGNRGRGAFQPPEDGGFGLPPGGGMRGSGGLGQPNQPGFPGSRRNF